MQVLLDPSNIESAVQLVTKVDGHKVSLQVIMHRVKKRPKVNFFVVDFQTCTEVYDLLNDGDFGASGQKAVESYRKSCHEIFPLATKFNLEQLPQHHVNNNSVNSDKSSKLKSNDEIEP